MGSAENVGMAGVAGGLRREEHDDPAKVGVGHLVVDTARCVEVATGGDVVDQLPYTLVPGASDLIVS